jgi:homocitrate synthase NifV
MLKKDRAWVRKTLTECVVFAQDRGYSVTVGFQDASRADVAFMGSLASEMQRLSVKSVRLADTVGILTPMRSRRLLESLTAQTEIPFGIHTHNDLGMATAVAAEAVKGGAVYVDTTLLGIGERAGNCDSYKFMTYKHQGFQIKPVAADLEKLQRAAKHILFPNGGEKAWDRSKRGDYYEKNYDRLDGGVAHINNAGRSERLHVCNCG